MDLGLLIGLNGPIDRIHPGKEHRHRRQELFFQQGDLFFPIGVSADSKCVTGILAMAASMG